METTRDFLLELGVEEMPSAPLTRAAAQLEPMLERGLSEAGLAHGAIRVISTPRRLAVLAEAVATTTEELREVLRGPAATIAFDEAGAPTKAAAGFARKAGIEASELIRRQDSDGREYVFAERIVPARPATPLLSHISEHLIAQLSWPNYRSQHWGSTRDTFVRPIRWICALFGSELVPCSYAGVHAGHTTRGHRVLGPGEHLVADPASYEAVLEQAFVLDAPRRAEIIRDGIARVERELGVRVDTPQKTFDEVVNLCEWPTVLVGNFDPSFLEVPSEIICESMLSHQRYFPTYDEAHQLTTAFVVVSNADPAVSQTVIDGNERVVAARLADAKFFYEEDLKVSLDEMRSRLDRVGFHEKLGSVLKKVERIEDITLAIAAEARLGAKLAAAAARAAHLSKSDLVSNAVIEFTSQQGVMGGYYALAAGEGEEVAHAIRDQYRPRFAGDELPETLSGCVLAVADKLDTISSLFAIAEPPTGSKDPYALRRAAIGVLNILRSRLEISYEPIVRATLHALAGQGVSFDAEEVETAICSFLLGRAQQMARDEGIAADTVAAISAGTVRVPQHFFDLAHALEHARAEAPETFVDLAVAYARASHLADASFAPRTSEVYPAGAEADLSFAIDQANTEVVRLMADHDYRAVISKLAGLRDPIDRFFDEVMVMDEDADLRRRRVGLLNRFVGVFADIADVGLLEGA
ncbi:glycine--tRNA ligase subunit beta [Collinsella sp. AGMB00827]|uniref:Glycine--tRNA ligase beta subunit n=1 Tax=Collinsella ureilytica TaxID=2869515 RepID=A0ABS7ML10_9ACTN|nr:glycine--tRNA ligase subunit beta [Collinsella urealyticum]MBY4798049.1 glycine--tRNA ligase subunit beta [Collinsella urealyticum]